MKTTYSEIEKNYIGYKFFKNLFFTGAAWLFFYRLFMSDQTIGLLEALAFGLGLAIEIPSGTLADRFGRKRVAMFGALLSGVGFIIQGMASSYLDILIGQFLTVAGWSLSSGADEALFYENMPKKDQKTWERILDHGNRAASVSLLIGTFFSGLLYGWNKGSIFYFSGIGFILSALFLLKMTESKNLNEGSGYMSDFREGLKSLAGPNVRRYLPLILVVWGFYYTACYGLLRSILILNYGFSASSGSYILTIGNILVFILLTHRLKKSKPTSANRLLLLTTITACASLFAIFDNKPVGIIVVLLITVMEFYISPAISSVLAEHLPSDQRATALSGVSFIKSLPYLFAAPAIGYLNNRGHLDYLMIGWAIAMIFSLLPLLKPAKVEVC
jgi:MFS transporter, DHA3 family, tetracycline resistance protein